MKTTFLVLSFVIAITCSAARADDYTIQAADEAAPADELSAEIAAELSNQGIKVMKGSSRTVCEIWLCKKWEANADFKSTPEVLYPFQPGQLIGVLRFKRRGADFRDQDIQSGVYTLRYAQQPVDGNHEGTSPTRDFLVMVNAEVDKSAKPFDLEELMTVSAESAESNHPGMMCLQKAVDADELPSLRHDEDNEWWIAQLIGKSAAGGKSKDLRVDLVVVGYADE